METFLLLLGQVVILGGFLCGLDRDKKIHLFIQCFGRIYIMLLILSVSGI